ASFAIRPLWSAGPSASCSTGTRREREAVRRQLASTLLAVAGGVRAVTRGLVGGGEKGGFGPAAGDALGRGSDRGHPRADAWGRPVRRGPLAAGARAACLLRTQTSPAAVVDAPDEPGVRESSSRRIAPGLAGRIQVPRLPVGVGAPPT